MPPQSPAPPGPSPTPIPGPPVSPGTQPYDFITNPDEPSPGRASLSLPGASSTAMRALYVVGGLLVLIILFIFIKNLFGGNSNWTYLVGVAQDQQEIIHLTTNASQQPGLTVDDTNFSATSQLSLSSAQANLITYLKNNGHKVNLKTLDLKVSASADTQLTNAAAAGNFDPVFQQVMKSKLATYMSDLQLAYKQTSGKNGRALLSDQYRQAQLLLVQLGSPTS